MSTVHVAPIGDLVTHDTDGSDCVCGPSVEFVPAKGENTVDGWLVTHHSLDGRETVEP